MIETFEPEFIAQLVEKAVVVETNAQLLMTELRETRRMVERATSTLSLVIGLFANARESDRGLILNRVSNDLLTCAEMPDIATQMVGCAPQCIDPSMLRAAAALLFGDESPLPGITTRGVTAH
jgi:hypothetical protein